MSNIHFELQCEMPSWLCLKAWTWGKRIDSIYHMFNMVVQKRSCFLGEEAGDAFCSFGARLQCFHFGALLFLGSHLHCFLGVVLSRTWESCNETIDQRSQYSKQPSCFAFFGLGPSWPPTDWRLNWPREGFFSSTPILSWRITMKDLSWYGQVEETCRASASSGRRYSLTTPKAHSR